jgi:hypothetical protein
MKFGALSLNSLRRILKLNSEILETAHTPEYSIPSQFYMFIIIIIILDGLLPVQVSAFQKCLHENNVFIFFSYHRYCPNRRNILNSTAVGRGCVSHSLPLNIPSFHVSSWAGNPEIWDEATMQCVFHIYMKMAHRCSVLKEKKL